VTRREGELRQALEQRFGRIGGHAGQGLFAVLDRFLRVDSGTHQDLGLSHQLFCA
jgi:hypothetical protein